MEGDKEEIISWYQGQQGTTENEKRFELKCRVKEGTELGLEVSQKLS